MYKLDDLSILFGRLEWDCILISRGVRMLGDHTFYTDDYSKIEDEVMKLKHEYGVEFLFENDEKTVTVIVYHPEEGRRWLELLQKTIQTIEKSENTPRMLSALEKIFSGEKHTEDEKAAMKEAAELRDKMEGEYGRVYGYSESSIRRYLDKISNSSENKD